MSSGSEVESGIGITVRAIELVIDVEDAAVDVDDEVVSLDDSWPPPVRRDLGISGIELVSVTKDG